MEIRKFRVKQVDDVFIPQVWRIYFPFWTSFMRTYTGYDWSVHQCATLDHAWAAIDLHNKQVRPVVTIHTARAQA